MSKRFKSQDYFRYKKLGKRWRKPVGLQSKLRLKKGGSGMKPAIGYGSKHAEQPTVIRSMSDFENCTKSVVFSSALGAKKTSLLSARAKELGIRVLNMKKVKHASRIEKQLDKKRQSTRKEQEKKEKEAKSAKEKAQEVKEKKMGFDDDVVPQVLEGKTRTYRLRDHGLKAGDTVAFENTQKGEVFGHAKITKAEKTVVEEFNLDDPEHFKIYNNAEELMEALKKRNPDREVTPKTEMFAYTYEFTPAAKDAKRQSVGEEKK